MEIIVKCSDDLRGSKNVFGEPIQEIVRCKDCKHWGDVPIACGSLEDHECHLIDGNKHKIRIGTPSYWFCPEGERRNE